MRAPLASFAVLAPGLALALAGCGDSATLGNGVASKDPAQIVAAAEVAATHAATVHVAGSILSAGKPISINMELVAGKGGQGQVALEGLSLRLINVDRALYVNGSAAFYRRFAGRAAARLLHGKWLKGPVAGGAFSALGPLLNLRTLLSSTLAAHGTLTRGPTPRIDGRQAVGVRDTARGGTLYVATTGAPYPLEITDGPRGGRIVFDRWNQLVTLAAPAGAVDLDQLHRNR